MSASNPVRVAMCSPDFFSVSYTINPWMQPEEWSANKTELEAQARAQWQNLHDTLVSLGAEVFLQPPKPGVPDMVFTANAGVVLDNKVLLARFHDVERQGEEPHDAAFFEDLAAKGVIDAVRYLPEGLNQEGAGDCLWDPARRLFWAGYGQRSRIEAYEIIEDVLGSRVLRLELVDPRYYHIDTCLALLRSGHVVYYPPAFSKKGLNLLDSEIGEEFMIPAGGADASRLGVNLVNIGETVVMSVCSDQLERRLNAAGFDVVRTPLPAFCLSGGAAACLTLRLDFKSDEASAEDEVAA